MSQESEKSALICPTLHHYGLVTAHQEEMLDWYARVLGMTTNFQASWEMETGASAGLAFVSNDRAHHRLALVSWPGMRDDTDKQTHVKIQHVAFEYATLYDLPNSWERLKGLGIEPVLRADHGPTIAFYYHDPDGNIIELFADTFGDWDKSTEYMRTSPEFHRNSMGTFIDPEQLMATRKAGATLAELHRRVYAGEFWPARPMDPRVLL
jgi:catechol 2,3-dioxygenase